MESPPEIQGLEFKKIVGRGGMSVVWLAWHEGLGKDVAVKVLNAEAAQSGRDIRQFMQETRVMTELDHPNIVKGYLSDRAADGRYYFVMEYVDGYTFGEFLAKKTVLPESDSLIIAQTAALALEYAWEKAGIVHCDIKPENIMVNSSGEIKIADFGLCEIYSDKPNPVPEEILGTPAYMSPEQILAEEKADFRSDIYSLGASLYHLATKNLLFDFTKPDDILRAHVEEGYRAVDPRVFNRSLSSGFVHLVQKMTVKNRDGRYNSWRKVYEDAKTVESTGILPGIDDNTVSSVKALN